MVSKKIALQFANEWVKSWNSHDIDSIMQHYADDVILVSPIAGKLLGNPEVKGKDAVKDYFIKGLQAYSDLKFTILDVLHGEQSIIIFYLNQNGIKAGEFMEIDSSRKVSRMYAHYSDG